MPDVTVITVNKRAEFRLIRSWYKANSDVKERGVLQYPVAIIYRDDTTANINDTAEMMAAKEACK
jgi:hypothetical protein